jgi:hypothetical protein
MRSLLCEEPRALRTLHPRWPHRRFHSRHDVHLLKRVRRTDCLQISGRARGRAGLSRRPRRPSSR